MVDNPVSPPAGVPERPPTTEPSPTPPSGEILAVPSKKSSRAKIILAALSLLIILASLPIAIYLVQQRQEIRKEAATTGKQKHCTSPQCTVTLGPDYVSFVAKGHGTRETKTPTINLNIPSGSTVYKAYAIWGGERKTYFNQDDRFKLVINGGSPQQVVGNLATFKSYISDYDTNEDSFLADITTFLPTDTTSFTFKVDSGFLTNYNADGAGGAGHGISIIIVYKNSTNPYSKITIKLWGEFVLRNTSADMAFNISDRKTDSTDIRAAFFFGEGEGSRNEDRPNYLYYNEQNNKKLNPTDGTSYPAWGSDPGHWWDTRITGDDLPSISALGNTATFHVYSPAKPDDPQRRLGDSIVWQGGIMEYQVTPPEALQCLSLLGEPDLSGLSPGDEVALTCTASSDPTTPIDHFEFRVSSDSGTPAELPPVSATKTNGEYEGATNYEIPDYACYKVECRACTSSDSSQCTAWGQAQ